MYSPHAPPREESGSEHQPHSPSVETAPEGAAQDAAPNCPGCGRSIPTVDVDEAVCPGCDVVVEDHPLSTAPEPTYGPEDRAATARTGGRVTVLYADRGVGVGVTRGATTDGNGNSLSRTQRRVTRDRDWTKHRSSDEVRLDYGLGEIRRMGAAYDVPTAELGTAALLYRRARRADLLHGRSADGFATACLLVAVRQSPLRIPVSERELSAVSRASDAQIRNARGALELFLDVEVPPMDPVDFVPRIRSALSTTPRVERCATTLLRAHEREAPDRGFSPRTLVAAAFHAALDLIGVDERPTLADIAAATGVSVGTISDRKGHLMQYREAWMER